MRIICLGFSFLLLFSMAACDQNRTMSPEEEKAKAHAQKVFQEFRESMKHTLEVADQKLDSLSEKAKAASGETRKNLEKEIGQLQEHRKKAKAEMEKMGEAFSANWEQMKVKVQKSVTDLNEAAEAAWKKLKD